MAEKPCAERDRLKSEMDRAVDEFLSAALELHTSDPDENTDECKARLEVAGKRKREFGLALIWHVAQHGCADFKLDPDTGN